MQELQVKQKDEEFSLELLKKGHAVTTYEVTKMLNAFFDTRVPGLPYFNPTRLTRYSTSDKDVYNNMFKEIREDLENAYMIYNNQTDYGVIINGDYDMRMETANKAIDSLILQTQILEEYTKKKIAYTPYIINFNDLTDVNTKNLVTNNIPYTTSEIDYNTSTLRNELQSLPNDKLDLSTSIVKITSTDSDVKLDKDVSVIFSEVLNNALTVTTSTTSENPNSLTVSVDLQESHDVSRIDFIGYSLYNTKISLYISEDGMNFFEKATTPGDPNMVWRFNQTSIKSIKIIISKTEFDYRESSNTDGICYFMINNLSIYLDKYKKTSVYTSKTIEMEDAISDVTVSPIHEVPPKTDIQYFVGYENKNNNVEWKTIYPDKQLDLGLLYKEDMALSKYVYDYVFGNRVWDRANKSFYFRIYSLPDYTNLNSIELRAGLSQWLMQPLDCSDKYPDTTIEVYDETKDMLIEKQPAVGVPSDLKCHTNDYAYGRVTAMAPLDSTIMEIRAEKTNNYFIMSQYAICDKDTIVENRYIEFDSATVKTKDTTISSETHQHLGVIKEVAVEHFDCLVLINGKQIFPKDGKYTFRLKKGENLIQIMCLLVNNQALDAMGVQKDHIKTIRHNFNLIAYTKELYAGPPMQRINYNALLKNIDAKSLKYYAIKKENLKDKLDPNAKDDFHNVIVTKFDPNFILKGDGIDGHPIDPRDYDVDATEVNYKPVEQIVLNKVEAKVKLGTTLQLTARLVPLDATDQAITWRTSDDTVATVDSTGLVTGLTLGVVNITATDKTGTITAKCVVTVVITVTGKRMMAAAPPTTIHFNDRDYQPEYDENNEVIIPVEGDTMYPEYIPPDVFLNNSEYMRVHLKFKHMLPSVKANITNADGNSNVRLRIMAKLSTADVSVSPAIKAIKIVGE
jgi:uncharacterized protein YjdB